MYITSFNLWEDLLLIILIVTIRLDRKIIDHPNTKVVQNAYARVNDNKPNPFSLVFQHSFHSLLLFSQVTKLEFSISIIRVAGLIYQLRLLIQEYNLSNSLNIQKRKFRSEDEEPIDVNIPTIHFSGLRALSDRVF